MDVNEALRRITNERRDVDVTIIPEGSMVTMEICSNRVRLWTQNGVVSRVPKLG